MISFESAFVYKKYGSAVVAQTVEQLHGKE